ncbi:MAG: 30S ribosomal protein S11 [Lentisphaeria bacterium]|nr:30S ribosomal protein S11 [Lentisphaeria bacterium]
MPEDVAESKKTPEQEPQAEVVKTVEKPAEAAAEAPVAAPAETPVAAPVAAPADAPADGAADAPADGAADEAAHFTRSKGGRRVSSGIIHVLATFNNTKVVVTDQQGNVLAWSSGGKMGYKGSRKSTSYVAQQIGTEVARKAMSMGMREAEVRLKGPGSGRESAARGIAAAGLDISLLVDVTPLPHNGCRPPKRRRV